MIFPRLHFDFETRSTRELNDRNSASVGLWVYANCPTTSVWMFSYRFEYAPGVYSPTLRWWRDQPLPNDVVAHIASGGPVMGHNVTFERLIWNFCLPRQLDTVLPVMTIQQTDCTMARARAVGLPGDLARAARVVNAPVQKDEVGADAMKKMAKPRAVWFGNTAAGEAYHTGAQVRAVSDDLARSEYEVLVPASNGAAAYWMTMGVSWWYDTTLRTTLSNYCDDDVGAECGIDRVVPFLSTLERETWELDQEINDNGIRVDVEYCKKVVQIVELAMAQANRRMWTLTGGKVKKCSDHGAVKRWLNDRGIACDSVAKGETDALVALSRTKGDDSAQEVIELHNASAKAATAKFKRAVQQSSDGDRLRHQFSYHVANTTGRWAGRGVQLQNLVRIDEDRELPIVRKVVAIANAFDPATAYDLIGVL